MWEIRWGVVSGSSRTCTLAAPGQLCSANTTTNTWTPAAARLSRKPSSSFYRSRIRLFSCPQIHAERHNGLVLLLLWCWLIRGLWTVGAGVHQSHRVDEQPHRLRQYQWLPSELLLLSPGCDSGSHPPAFPDCFCEVRPATVTGKWGTCQQEDLIPPRPCLVDRRWPCTKQEMLLHLPDRAHGAPRLFVVFSQMSWVSAFLWSPITRGPLEQTRSSSTEAVAR